MGALYDAAARALREPASDRQAQAWDRQNYFFDHQAELDAKRLNGAGTDSITAQRRQSGNGYLHVRDWCELDGYAFRCNTTRPFASVLLSLIAFKKLHAVQGSHEGLAEMMGVFGKLCCASTIRNAVAELVPLGLKVEPYFDHHPEGFRCRSDRRQDEDEETQRRLREWVEASPLYSLEPGGQLARFVEKVQQRAAVKKSRRPRRRSTRLPTDGNLSGSSLSDSQKEKQKDRAHRRCGKVDIAPSASAPNSNSLRAKERPTAANRSTARPMAAPEKAAMRGEWSRRSADLAHSHANGSAVASVPRSEAPASRRTPALVEALQLAPARTALAMPSPDLVRELVALALRDGADAGDRAARLAELEALADQQAVAELAKPRTPALALAPELPAVERLTPLQERRRNAVVLPFIRSQRDAGGAVQPPPLPSPAELAALDRAECLADAAKRSRGRIERPSSAPVGVGDAFECALAALRVHHDGGNPRDEHAAVAAFERERRRAKLEAIGGALDELHAAIARARLPRARVELIDRVVGNVVALYQRGQLDVDAVLAHLDVQRRALAELRDSDAAAAALRRIDEDDRERAVRDAIAGTDDDGE